MVNLSCPVRCNSNGASLFALHPALSPPQGRATLFIRQTPSRRCTWARATRAAFRLLRSATSEEREGGRKVRVSHRAQAAASWTSRKSNTNLTNLSVYWMYWTLSKNLWYVAKKMQIHQRRSIDWDWLCLLCIGAELSVFCKKKRGFGITARGKGSNQALNLNVFAVSSVTFWIGFYR